MLELGVHYINQDIKKSNESGKQNNFQFISINLIKCWICLD